MFIVALSACFSQRRFAFLFGVAVWCGGSAFVGTLFDSSAFYGASLAGYTTIIIASSAATSPDQLFEQAVSRASEIIIGIVCATTVLGATSRAGAGARLARELAACLAELAAGTVGTLRRAGDALPDTRPQQRALVRRIVAAGRREEEASGESSELRRPRGTLRSGLEGTYEALSEWRALTAHLRRLPAAEARRRARAVLDALPAGLGASLGAGAASGWARNAAVLRDACARATNDLPVPGDADRSSRLIGSSFAEWLLAVGRAANGVVLLLDPGRAMDVCGQRKVRALPWTR